MAVGVKDQSRILSNFIIVFRYFSNVSMFRKDIFEYNMTYYNI